MRLLRSLAVWGGIAFSTALFGLPAIPAAFVPPRGDWFLLADGASVRYRDIEGVQAGRTRSGWRSELSGSVAGVRATLQGFRYQPEA